jgi:uncharacterized membrane protein
MVLKVLHFVIIMIYVLVAGVMWGTWLSLGRTMTGYDATTFLADGHHMIANLAVPMAVPMAVLMVAAVVVGAIGCLGLLRRNATTAAWLAVAGWVFMIGVLVVTVAVEVPLDNEINRWTVATLPGGWTQQRARWATFHAVRTALSLLAVAAAVLAGLSTRTSVPMRPGARSTVDSPR